MNDMPSQDALAMAFSAVDAAREYLRHGQAARRARGLEHADAAVQIHGGNGYALEYEISRVLCDARILNIFEGAGSCLQRLRLLQQHPLPNALRLSPRR